MKLIEINQAGQQSELPSLASGDSVGVIVHGEPSNVPALEQFTERGVQCAAIAYILPQVRRKRRLMALGLGLSQCHQCRCAVFSNQADAKAWLNRQIH